MSTYDVERRYGTPARLLLGMIANGQIPPPRREGDDWNWQPADIANVKAVLAAKRKRRKARQTRHRGERGRPAPRFAIAGR